MIKAFKILFKSIREYKKPSILTILCMVVEVVMEVIIPAIMALLVDYMRTVKGSGDLSGIWKYVISLIVMAIISLLGGIGGGVFGAKASTGFAKNLRKDMYDNIQTFSFENIDKFSQASLITRMTNDVNRVQNLYQMLIRIVIRAPLMLVSSIVAAFILGGRMAFIFVVAMPVLVGGLLFLFRFVKPIYTRVFKKYDKLNESIQENVSGIRVVKSYVREDFEQKKFNRASEDITEDFVKAEKIMALNSPIMSFAMYATLLAVTTFGSFLIVSTNEGSLSTGQMSSLLNYGMQCLMSLNMISMIFVFMTVSTACVKRLADVMVEKQTISNCENPITKVKDGSIEFKNVSFKYAVEAKKYALKDINLKINSGDVIGIIGATGTGKTTLVNLISRLYDTTKGSVLVGGVDVKKYDLKVLRDAVSVVLQKNVLFSGTIISNLQWGKENATMEEMKRVCDIAQADEFIQQLPNKYEYHVEQGGTNVSGGQKQRLCIARALLKDPKILIFDDSTSAVDTRTDAKIRNGLANELPDTTKIIIAQRISSIENATKIIVMNDGTIDAIGTNEELLKSNKIYQEVYYTQNRIGGK